MRHGCSARPTHASCPMPRALPQSSVLSPQHYHASMPLVLALSLLAGTLLPTGATLDPAAPTRPVGNFPLAIALAPEGDRAALLLCGWRKPGVQIVETATGNVLQTLDQPSAFVG